MPSCRQCLLCPRESDEEGVALRVDLDAAVAPECLAQNAAVFSERLRIAIAELLHQPRRAFDVGEEERDRAGR